MHTLPHTTPLSPPPPLLASSFLANRNVNSISHIGPALLTFHLTFLARALRVFLYVSLRSPPPPFRLLFGRFFGYIWQLL